MFYKSVENLHAEILVFKRILYSSLDKIVTKIVRFNLIKNKNVKTHKIRIY